MHHYIFSPLPKENGSAKPFCLLHRYFSDLVPGYHASLVPLGHDLEDGLEFVLTDGEDHGNVQCDEKEQSALASHIETNSTLKAR